MKPASMKRKIASARNELNWPILEKPHDLPMVRVTSNSKNKTHIIYTPDKLKNRSTDMDYLHELGHALFCERIHPMFSVNVQCAPTMKKRLFVPTIPAINVACDWFVGDWQIKTAEKQSLTQLKKSLSIAEEILSGEELPPLEIILDASMIIAQSILYLHEQIDCGGILKNVVDAFLSIPPDQPTVEHCVTLINKLLATYTKDRLRLVPGGDLDAWEICSEEPGDDAPQESSMSGAR